MFTLPMPDDKKFQYPHGLLLSSDGSRVIITYGVDDMTSWRVAVPLTEVLGMFDPTHPWQGPWSSDGVPELTGRGAVEFPELLFGKGVEQNLLEMEASLRLAGGPIAAGYLSLLERVGGMSTWDLVGGLKEHRRVLERAEEAEGRCRGAVEAGRGCAKMVEAGDAAEETMQAFWAYSGLLARGHSLIEEMVARRHALYVEQLSRSFNG
jgi:hypothetical protein